MTTFFTSDLHLGHAKVAALRGFGESDVSPALHDMEVGAAWLARVRPDDVVYVLGDLSAGGRVATEHALRFLSYLPGRKRLIIGNHDPVHPMNRNAWKWSDRFADVFEQIAPFARAKVLGREVVLSHFPYERDRGTPRYLQWRLRDEGLPLLHGHTHGPERLTVTPPQSLDPWSEGYARLHARVEVHVGLDAWGRPVRDEEVAALLDEAAER